MSLLRRLQFIISAVRNRASLDTATLGFLETSRLVAGLIFIFTVLSILLISYAGVSNAHLPVLPGQVATVSVHAGAPFNYVSKERTRQLGERLKNRVPPVYRIDLASYKTFEDHFKYLLAQLELYEKTYPPGLPTLANRRQVLAELVTNFNRKGPYRANVEDVATFLNCGDAETRQTIAARCLVVLQEIYREGTHDQTLSAESIGSGMVSIFHVTDSEGEIMQRPVLSMEEAMTFLRVNISAEGMPRELATSLFRLFRNGLIPNIVFDKQATDRREAEAVKSIQPVNVQVDRGQAIIEAGAKVSEDQYEMLNAHREYMQSHQDLQLDEGLQLLGRILMVLVMVAASLMYIRLEDPDTLRSNSRVALLALVVIVNLALVRLTYALLGVEFFVHNPTWAAMLPYLAPTALAPLIVAILIDAGSAIFMALFISIFTGVIYGNRFDVQVLTFLAAIIAINGCRSVRKRGSVVRAATVGGLALSIITLLMGLVGQTPFTVILRQMAAGMLTGIVTGIAVVGFLPVLEALFRRTTDITLLELTDFNHPLMRTMQMESPGTYHHSLVVAQLSENAAAAIGANPLLARVCALYHDIGKTANPGFFTENQNEGRNPHDNTPPEVSAHIIRRHVSEGVELAQKHNLPKAVVDVIRQHHGTTLIKFFYHKARLQAGLSATPGNTNPPLPGQDSVTVNELLFRYEGPKPRFKECAIIALADSIEAAARSLKEFTPVTLQQLMDNIIHDRMADGQLDEAPLTLAELASIKESFSSTLLNMLHSRVSYNKNAAP